MRSRAAVLLAALAALLAGCGGPEDDGTMPTPEAALQPAPELVTTECEAAAAVYRDPLLCPRRLPPSRDPALLEFGGRARVDRCGWQIGMLLRGTAFHVLFGGQCRPLPLGGAPGEPWKAGPRAVDDALGLVGHGPQQPGDAAGERGPLVRPTVVRRDVMVRGRPSVVLAWGPYPAAGTVHAGHQALVWNEDGQGMVVSAHFDRDVPAQLRLRILRAVAASMRPVG